MHPGNVYCACTTCQPLCWMLGHKHKSLEHKIQWLTRKTWSHAIRAAAEAFWHAIKHKWDPSQQWQCWSWILNDKVGVTYGKGERSAKICKEESTNTCGSLALFSVLSLELGKQRIWYTSSQLEDTAAIFKLLRSCVEQTSDFSGCPMSYWG